MLGIREYQQMVQMQVQMGVVCACVHEGGGCVCVHEEGRVCMCSQRGEGVCVFMKGCVVLFVLKKAGLGNLLFPSQCHVSIQTHSSS